ASAPTRPPRARAGRREPARRKRTAPAPRVGTTPAPRLRTAPAREGRAVPAPEGSRPPATGPAGAGEGSPDAASGWRDEPAWQAAWRTLERHRETLKGFSLRRAFEADPGRFARLSRRLELGTTEMLVDFSKHLATDETLALLFDLARASGLERARQAMFAGERINVTEDRAVLHVALRDPSGRPMVVDGQDVMPAVRDVQQRMRAFVERVHAGEWRGYTGERITDVVNIEIGRASCRARGEVCGR